MIISEAHDVAPAMSLAGRRIVPVEAVYGVVEVKSILDRTGYDTFIDAVVELHQMRRYYEPLGPTLTSDAKTLQAGLSPQDNAAGKIWSGIIAFNAPEGATLADYLTKHCEGFWFICIPGRELVSLSTTPPGFFGAPYGLKSGTCQ